MKGRVFSIMNEMAKTENVSQTEETKEQLNIEQKETKEGNKNDRFFENSVKYYDLSNVNQFNWFKVFFFALIERAISVNVRMLRQSYAKVEFRRISKRILEYLIVFNFIPEDDHVFLNNTLDKWQVSKKFFGLFVFPVAVRRDASQRRLTNLLMSLQGLKLDEVDMSKMSLNEWIQLQETFLEMIGELEGHEFATLDSLRAPVNLNDIIDKAAITIHVEFNGEEKTYVACNWTKGDSYYLPYIVDARALFEFPDSHWNYEFNLMLEDLLLNTI